MALSLRFPGQIVPIVSESILTDGMVVRVGSADNTVRLPGGASPTTPLLGVMMRPDGSACAAGERIDLILSGIYPLIAGGTINAGDYVTSGGTNGSVIAESAGAGVNVAVIGQAIEDAVSGDRVACTIAPSMKQGG
jgi:hypothetical protein